MKKYYKRVRMIIILLGLAAIVFIVTSFLFPNVDYFPELQPTTLHTPYNAQP